MIKNGPVQFLAALYNSIDSLYLILLYLQDQNMTSHLPMVFIWTVIYIYIIIIIIILLMKALGWWY
jgi:hypothetical protein